VHEYSIVRALLDTVEQQARARRAIAVRKLTVRIGELSGVEPRLLASAFGIFRESTVCAGAELVIVASPTAWACPRCRAPVERGGILSCDRCGAPARLEGGDEILLEQIEMEVA
jgi:hydrogenase nickel incorporation protein HypA/HybF